MALYKVNSDTADLTKVAGGTLYADAPIASIVPYGGTTAPSGWLICQGQVISRITYSDLFSAIGTTFGAGDGSTTFNLPDLREATTKGAGLSGKSSAHYDADGVALGEFLDDRVQGHEHTQYYNRTVAVFTSAGGTGMDNRATTSTTGIVTDGTNGTPRIGNTTEVKAVGVNYIIKAKHTPVPADFMDAVDDAVETAMTKYDYTIPYTEQNTLEKVVKELVRRIASDSSIPIRSTLNVFLEWQLATIIQVNVAKFNANWVVVNGSSTDTMFWGGQVNDEWKWHQS